MTLPRRHIVELENQGLRLYAMVHFGKGGGKQPAVLICHGLGGTKVGNYRLYVRLAEKLAEEGITCFRLDCRGCGDSEGDFEDTTLHGWVNDNLLALKWLKHHEKIDPKRIGILGRSFGSVVAVATARRFSTCRSIALWSGVYNGAPWLPIWEDALVKGTVNDKPPKTVSFMGWMASTELFGPFFSMDMGKEMAHLNHMSWLHVHSEADQVVPFAQANHFLRMREQAPAPTKFVRMEKSDHDFHDLEERDHLLNETARWFKATL